MVIVGIIQGFVLSSFLLGSRVEKPRFYLGLLVMSFALDNLQYFITDYGLISTEVLVLVFIPYGFLCGPLYLLYNLSISGTHNQSEKTKFWLFLPFIIALVYSVLVKIKFAFLPDFVIQTTWLRMEMMFEFSCIAMDFTVLIYLMSKVTHNVENRNVRISTVLLLITSIAWLFVTIADYFFDVEYWNLVYISMSVVIYFLGHSEMLRGKISESSNLGKVFSKKKDEGKSQILEQFENLVIFQKKYLNPDLSLENIAEQMQISKSHLSRVINRRTGAGFSDYLNNLRVNQAKLHLIDPAFENYTISAIGLEAGFASKTTFNTTFKKCTGITPSAYKLSFSESSVEAFASS